VHNLAVVDGQNHSMYKSAGAVKLKITLLPERLECFNHIKVFACMKNALVLLSVLFPTVNFVTFANVSNVKNYEVMKYSQPSAKGREIETLQFFAETRLELFFLRAQNYVNNFK
jgi:hypothetical protein